MNCPTCANGEHRVIRTTESEAGIERMRECIGCGHRWPTLEAPKAVISRSVDIVEAFEKMRKTVGE